MDTDESYQTTSAAFRRFPGFQHVCSTQPTQAGKIPGINAHPLRHVQLDALTC
jgi:hypothetical protein